MWDNKDFLHRPNRSSDMTEEFTISVMQATCTYEPKWLPETHVPIGVNKYVDYLYSLSDSLSYNLTQKKLQEAFICN